MSLLVNKKYRTSANNPPTVDPITIKLSLIDPLGVENANRGSVIPSPFCLDNTN
jgi:hypothetical protein